MRHTYITALMTAIASAFLLSGCVKDFEPVNPEIGTEDPVPEGKVRFTFTPDFSTGTSTKAMTENAQVKNIYVSVFDANGYKLSEYVEATPNTLAGNNDTKYSYSVELTITDKPRILHIIANAPESLKYGSESEVIGSLCTEYDADDVTSFQEAYWQRVALDYIPAKPAADDPEYTAKMARYNAVGDILNDVKLIRNYSKVTAQSSASNFTLEGFWFINFPSKGTIAPYNRNSERFMSDYEIYPSVADLEGSGTFTNSAGETLQQGNYHGFMLATTEFITMSELNSENMNSATAGVATGYVYEREKALESPLYLIVKGKFDTGSGWEECYYKIAMQDKDGEFYAMLRNFNYLVDITKVACKGMTSVEDALYAAPSGDISVNLELQSLTNISDGDSRLTVRETNIVLVGEVGQPVVFDDFWYKYESDIKNHAGSAYNSPEVSTTNPYVQIVVNDDAGITGPVFDSYTVADGDDTGGRRQMTITTTNVTAVTKTQSMTITGYRWDGEGHSYTISRKINFRLRPNIDLSITCGPNTDEDGNGSTAKIAGSPATLTIGIEGALPSSMFFPMEFTIEADKKTLIPDNDQLPVSTGTSTIQDPSSPYYGKPAYWYIKNVSWADYLAAPMVDGYKIITCHFKTNADVSATNIYVHQKYFKQTCVQLSNFDPETFTTTLSKSSAKIGDELTFTYSMSVLPSDRKLVFAMKGMEPKDASGMTYLYMDSDGYDLYELSGVTSTSGSLAVIPYAEGDASIKISANKFTTATQTCHVASGSILVYANADGSGSGTRLAAPSGFKVYGDNLVAGQPAGRLTFYLSVSDATDVKIGNISASRYGSGANITVGGVTYYPYRTSTGVYTAPAQDSDHDNNTDALNDNLTVYINGNEPVGSVKVPVYGLNIASAILDNGHSIYDQNAGTGWYVMVNKSFEAPIHYHLYCDGSKIKGKTTSGNPYAYDALFGFSTTNTSVKVAVPAGSTSSATYYVTGTSNNNDLSLGTSGQNYNFQFDTYGGVTGARFNYTASYGSNKTRYWRQSSATGNAQISSTNSGNIFDVCPVTFVDPPAL